MKLAEALSERSDIRTRISALQSRLAANARVQEGERPAEDPKALMAELDALIAREEEMIARINLTNARTASDGKTITELLAARECLMLKVNVLRDFLDEASALTSRGMRTEIRVLSSVDVSAERKRVDGLSADLRALDMRIQALNWTTELI